MKPLEGIRILDLTRVLAGPFCTALMADLGAEVIKLEPPQGDDYRHIGPFVDDESALFALTNRGKSSLVMVLKTPQGQTLARQIAFDCDVVVENFRPGVAEKLGLGAADLRAAKPDLVYCSISGFGQTGPFTQLPAYDIVVQAMSGLMTATGEEDGPPLKVGEAMGDLIAGRYAAWAICAALVGRARQGQGATLDVAMLDTLFALLPTSHALHLYAKEPINQVGNRHPLSTPFGAYRAQDGHVIIAALGTRQFAALCSLIGQPQAASDPRFATDADRTRHEPVLRKMIEAHTASRPTADLIAALRAASIPAAPILTLAQVTASAHASARDLVQTLPHDRLGCAPVVGQPVRFDGQKHIATQGAPALGSGTRKTLTALGLTDAQIAGLIDAGIIAEARHD